MAKVKFIPATPAEVTPEDGQKIEEAPSSLLNELIADSHLWAIALSLERDRLTNLQRRIGYPVVLITAATGVGAFMQLKDNQAWWATLTVALFSFLAAGLAAIQTQGNYAARAKSAAEASGEWGHLHGDMLIAVRGGLVPNDLEKSLQERYESLKKERPAVSQRVQDRAQQRRKADLEAEMDQAELTSSRLGALRRPGA